MDELNTEIPKNNLDAAKEVVEEHKTPEASLAETVLSSEEKINILNSEIRDVNAKISDLESSNQETINSVNNIRAMFGAVSPLSIEIESTRANTEKMLELSKKMESLIEDKRKLTEKIPGMAEVAETFNPEEHKN